MYTVLGLATDDVTREEARATEKIQGRVRLVTENSLGVFSSRSSSQMWSSKQEESWKISGVNRTSKGSKE